MNTFEAITQNIKITVRPKYLNRDSSPSENINIWVYDVCIENLGTDSVTLLRRHWDITDGDTQPSIVEGDGVIGQQPTIHPGEKYSYASFSTLNNRFGFMEGYYEMVNQNNEDFRVRIPRFKLQYPVQLAYSSEQESTP